MASINLYLLEDGNPLTSAAYGTPPLLRFSYDGVYLSALVAHTLALNPISHALYMQGQPGASHFNGLLIGMALEVLVLFVCLVCLALALRSRA